MKQHVYKNNITGILKELVDKEYQLTSWARYNPNAKMTISFVEAANMLFDDCIIKDLLQAKEIIFDRAVTQALQELHEAVAVVDEYRPEEEIINDPLMQVVREKAAKALALIQASDYSESTVEIVE